MSVKNTKLPNLLKMRQEGHISYLLLGLLVVSGIIVAGYRVYNSETVANVNFIGHRDHSAVLGTATSQENSSPVTANTRGIVKIGSRGGEGYGSKIQSTVRSISREIGRPTDTTILEADVDIAAKSWPNTFPAQWTERYAQKGVDKNVIESGGKKIYNPPGEQSTESGPRVGVGGVTYPEAGAGSKGASGGKLIKSIKGASLAAGSYTFINVLKDGKEQQSSRYYEYGNRSYGILVYGHKKNTPQNALFLLDGVNVTFRLHAPPDFGGCNYTGQPQHYRAVTRVENSSGKVNLIRCTNQQFDLNISNVPAQFRGKVRKQPGGGYVLVEAKGGKYNAIKLAVVFEEDDLGISIRPKGSTKTKAAPQTAPSQQPDPGNEDDCLKNEASGNEMPVYGSHGKYGGEQRFSYRYDPTEPHTDPLDIDLVNVLSRSPTKLVGEQTDKCNKLQSSRDYNIIVRGTTLQRGDKPKLLKGVKVTLNFSGPVPGKCMGVGWTGNDVSPSRYTNQEGVAGFNNCTRNDIKLRIQTNDKGLNEYRRLLPVKDGAQYYAKVNAQTQKGGQRVFIYITLVKPYSDEWLHDFAAAANHYWYERHKEGIPEIDKKAVHGPLVRYPGSASCKPNDVWVTIYSGKHWANAGIGGGVGGTEFNDLAATKGRGSSECAMEFNLSKQAKRYVGDRVHACLIYVHEYGHFLGYPDFEGLPEGITTADIMYNHLRGTKNTSSMNYKQAVADTGCAAVTKNKPFAKFVGNSGAVVGASGKAITNKVNSKNKKKQGASYKLPPYSKKTKDHFAAIARDYWKSHQNPGPNYPGMGKPVKLDSSDVECTPGKVKFIRTNKLPSINPNASSGTQYEYLMWARPGGAYVKHKKEWKHKGYCEVYVNKSESARTYTSDNFAFTCVLFVHAYGRLLGYGNTNQYPDYIMYYLINRQSAAALARDLKCTTYFPVGGTGL